MKLGIQLYTLRDFAEKDLEDVLKKISSYGYDGVELAGLYGKSAQEIKDLLDKYNLTALSAHVSYQELEESFDAWCENARIFGMDKLSIPGYDMNLLRGDAFFETAKKFNSLIERYAEKGIKIGFHNHDGEFADGIIENMEKECPNLKFEFDTYWITFAKKDPVAYLKSFGSKVFLIHLKDMKPGGIEHSTPNPAVMEGILDITAILNCVKYTSAEWVVVEMDTPDGDAFELVRKSAENLKASGLLY